MLWLVLDLIVNMLWCLGSLYKALKVQHFDQSIPQHRLINCGAQEHSLGLPKQPLNTY
uniref:Uncharacterized protein n=1 Tax=Helianthus annuus TaxID=4232 RepID=A0A251SK52_HELAN